MKNIYRFIRLPFGGFVPLGFLFVVFCLFAITNPLRAQWIQTNGPSGVSSTNCLAVSGTNLFAGTNKGVFLTTDNGTTWSAVNTGLPTNTTVNALAIGGTNIFAGTSNGVYLSTNNATNWSAVNTGFPFIPTVSAFAIDGINIFAGTSNGVYLSTDNGTSWTSTHSNPIFTTALVVNGMDLFAANGTGVSYSTDNGTSWTAVNTGLTNTSVKSLAVSGTNLFTGTLGGGVFLSTNNGTSWVPASTGLPTDDGVYALAVSPDGAGGTNLFAGTLGGGVFFSTNNGTNWAAANPGSSDFHIYSLIVSSANLFAGTGSGSGHVWRTPLSYFSVLSKPTLNSPFSGALNQPLSPTISWDGDSVAFNYHLQVSKDSSFTSLDYDDSTITTNSNRVSPLTSNTVYYWRVSELNFTGASQWSSTWHFTTRVILAPNVISPANGAVNQPLSPTLSWTPGIYPSTYHLQVAKDSTFSSPIFDNPSLTVTSKQIVSLVSNTQYYWRVATIDSGNASSWSPAWNFATRVILPPNVIAPAIGSVNQPLSPTLSWTAGIYPSTYHLQVAKDSTFSSPVFDNSSLTAASKQIISLVSNTTYYWRMTTTDSGYTSSWSPVWYFTTRLILPPIVIAPANGSVNQPLAPTLSWSAGVPPSTHRLQAVTDSNISSIPYIFAYHLQVAIDSNFTSIIFDSSTITTTSKQLGTLASNTTYYWRIMTLDSGSTSAWTTSHFTTHPILSPTLVSPANGSVNQPLSPTLSWNAPPYASTNRIPATVYSPLSARADSTVPLTPSLFAYHLQVATDSNFSAIIFDSSAITTTSKKLRTLASNTTYYWRLMTLDSGSTSAWTTSYFTTRFIYPPALVSPANGSVKQPLSPTLSWNEAPYTPANRLLKTYSPLSSLRNIPKLRLHMAADTIADTTSSPSPSLFAYRLQVAADSNFLSLTFDNSNIKTTSEKLSTLAGNTIYYWRVMTLDSGSTSAWSSLWNFMTDVNPPSNFSALAGNDKISLTWLASSSSNIIKYRIYRGTSSPASTLHDSTASTSYVDTGLTNGVKYFYRITTENNQYLEGTFSSEVSATPFNQPPHAANLQSLYDPNAGNIQSTSLNFSSTGSSDADGTIDSVFWYVNGSLISKQSSLTYSFTQGTNQVKLVVQDNQRSRDSSIATINRLMFKAFLSGPVYAGPSLLGQNILYVIGTGDAVYRMNAGGNVLYGLKVGGEIRSSSSIAYDTTAYIASSDNNLYAFSGNGTSLWPALPLGGELSATAAIDSVENRIYIGVANDNFVAVDRTAGKAVWNYFADAPIVGSAAMTLDRKLVVATVKGTVYGFDLNALSASPTPTWQISLSDSIFGSPAIDAAGNIYYCTGTGKIDKITMPAAQQASTVWQTQVGGSIDGSPVIDGSGTLYVGSADGKLYAIDIQSGNIKWSYPSGAPIFSTPTISNVNMIYFGNHGGEVFAIDTNEVLHWHYQDSTSVDAPLLYNDGVLYAGTIGGRLIAFYDNADSSTRGTSMTARLNKVKNITSVPVWGTFQGNNQRTGVPAGKVITAVASTKNEIPNSYSLSQNYPNPFNPSTTLQYGLPATSHVSLRIYNILGQVVAELVNGEQAAGWYELKWNANVSTGMYIYRLDAVNVKDPNNRFVQVKKMLLLK